MVHISDDRKYREGKISKYLARRPLGGAQNILNSVRSRRTITTKT